ncbi:MAG: cysteine--tRNA ligase [Clostridia bacterium]|nr:cysteine--tRNA ligase [Clostridia bacterium]
MLKIYNTLTRKKEEFKPLNDGKVTMYACGITVSGEAHIGHAYQALIYDIIRKYLVSSGYDVTYARNYTDVDDKIIAKSHETGIPADKYAEMMIAKIDKEMRALQVDDPDIWLKATCTMDGIMEFIGKLIDKGHAYATSEGDVYFAVESFKDYGKLSGRRLEDAFESVRIENEDNKQNPLDFALWKSAKEGEPYWESPWGKGRPGWHIECSAMNMKAFGEQIDIHGGGRDLIFPHHENEIAQTEALTGKTFAKYWIHNGLIKVNGQKMSKSLGNSLVLHDLIEKYHPETIKMALLQTNYRGDINVTDTLFPEAEKHMTGFYKIIDSVYSAFGREGEGIDHQAIEASFKQAMDDDFNTAKALANLFGIFKKIKAKVNTGDKTAVDDVLVLKRVYGLLGFFRAEPKDFIEKAEPAERAEESTSSDIPSEVMELVKARAEAKASKNWPLADEIRGKITALGYTVKDTKDGAVVEKL